MLTCIMPFIWPQVTRLQYLNALMASRVAQSPDPPEIKILPNSQTKLLNDRNTTQGNGRTARKALACHLLHIRSFCDCAFCEMLSCGMLRTLDVQEQVNETVCKMRGWNTCVWNVTLSLYSPSLLFSPLLSPSDFQLDFSFFDAIDNYC